MKNQYQVEVLEMTEVHEIPNGWTNEDYFQLLNDIDFDDASSIAVEELKDMTAMALSDLDLEEAVVKTLALRLGEKLNRGQRQNLVQELQDDRLWEEYSEISYHKELFNSACMLHLAFPKKFSEPDIVKIKLKIKAMNHASMSNLESPNASFLCRVLNDGMDDHNIIYRLFDEQLAADKFPEAEHIIWKYAGENMDSVNQSREITIYTSWNWVDELKGVKSYDSIAYGDGQLK